MDVYCYSLLFVYFHNSVKPSDAAGKFGMYQNCDVPTWTFEDMLKHISETEKVTSTRMLLLCCLCTLLIRFP